MPLTSDFDNKDKLLIIHADDVGMCHSVNEATFIAFQQGIVSSCSMMMPCPWILEAANFFRENQEYDHGVHSTLTSEWLFYRWGPVSPKNEVPSLLDEQQYMWRDAKDSAKAPAKEVELELIAQVERTFSLGLHPSHLDTHMGTVYFRPDLLEIYIKVALEKKLIPMLIKPTEYALDLAKEMGIVLSKDTINNMLESGLPMLDNFFGATFGSDLQERIKWFRAALSEVKPGTITQVIVHLGLHNNELKAIMPSYIERWLDYELVTSKEAARFVEALGFTLVGWKDLRPAACI